MCTWLAPSLQETADLAVVIVSWNVKDLLEKNIESLLRSEGSISARIIVVDNASQDGSAHMVREKFSVVDVIENSYNAGFAGGVDQGIIARKSRHVLLLNPDMHVEPDALQKTVEYLDAHPTVAVMGGKLTTEDGRMCPHVRRFPDIWSQLAVTLKVPHFFPGLLDHYMATDFDYACEQDQSVDSVRGSYFAISERALRYLGGLDTRYFIWFEEVDYCKNARSKGWDVMFVPWVRATDYVGRSFKQVTRYWAQKQFSRSMVQYFEKWHPGWQSRLLKTLRPFGLASGWLLDQWQSWRTKQQKITPS